MANPYHHAVSGAKKWGGEPEDYWHIHNWFDESKGHHADFRHRALRHHSEGIFMCEKIFGPVVERKSDGKKIPTRWIGEQHVQEDLGFIPSLSDWLKEMKPQAWMARSRKLSQELEDQKTYEQEDQRCQDLAVQTLPAAQKDLPKTKLDVPDESLPTTKTITVQF